MSKTNDTKSDWRCAVAGSAARIEAIMTSPHAKGREALAEHLAFETREEAGSAIALLKAAPEGRGARASWAQAIAKVNARNTGATNVKASDSTGGWAKAIARANARVPRG